MNLEIPGEGPYSLIPPLVGFRQKLEQQLEQFPFEDNVFLMMRFKKASESLSTFMIETLQEAGLRGVRADDPRWILTEDVYNPLAVLYCCKYGIALFDEPRPGQAYNPNVVYELAIMQYQGKDCLILRHASLPALPFDLIKNLYYVYDRDLAVRENIRKWISKIRPSGTSPGSQLPTATNPKNRTEIRTPGETIEASDFDWGLRGRGKMREVRWNLRIANTDQTAKVPKIHFILMAEDGFMLTDHAARLKELGAGEDRQARSTFKITADLARRLERIMVVCRGETVPTE